MGLDRCQGKSLERRHVGHLLTFQQRVLLDFTPAVEGSLEKSFKSRGLDRMDSWHLFEMVVDPVYQGQGGDFSILSWDRNC